MATDSFRKDRNYYRSRLAELEKLADELKHQYQNVVTHELGPAIKDGKPTSDIHHKLDGIAERRRLALREAEECRKGLTITGA